MPILQDFLRARFFRGQQAQTSEVLISVGGVDNSSASLTYDVNHYTGGALIVTGPGGGIPVILTGTNSTRIFDSSGNSIIATNTNPVGTEQGVIVRLAAAQALQGATAPNSPVVIGAEGRTTDGTAVTNGQLIRLLSDSLGKLVVLQGAVNDLHLDGQTNIAQIAAAAVIPNQGAGKRIVLQSILAVCSGSQTVQVIVSGGPNNRTFGYAFPGSGFMCHAGGAPLYITSASTALSVQGDVTSTMNIFATGYSIVN